MSRSRILTFLARLLAVLCVPLVSSVAFVSPASADARRGAGPQNARFDGRTIDLSKGWGGAQSCVVLTPDVRCFTTYAEADAFLGLDRTNAPAVLGPNCPSGWLCLYDGLNGGGRRLQFRDEYWNNLWDYDFAREASSVHNNQGCSDPGALDEVPPGNVTSLDACSFYFGLADWDNRATGVHG